MFAMQLKKLRKKNKISQKELAEAIFISQQAIAKWETGKASPNPETLILLANHFNVSVDYLVGNSEKDYNEIDYSYIDLVIKAKELNLNKKEVELILEFFMFIKNKGY